MTLTSPSFDKCGDFKVMYVSESGDALKEDSLNTFMYTFTITVHINAQSSVMRKSHFAPFCTELWLKQLKTSL